MGTISEKLVYLNSTKQAIKQAINEDFEVIDNNTTFREYADEISSNNAKYKDLIPKETKNATNTLDISNSSGLDKALVTQYGNTYQETTTGKNLANYNDNINNSVPNLTITTDSDGYIIVNGTKNVGYPVIVNQVEITDILEDGETYTLWQEDITPSGTSGFSKCENRIRAINTQGQYSNVRTLGRHTNRLVVDKTTFLRYFVDVVLPNNAETYNNYKNRFMLLKGSYNDSDLIEYEKYTNGASPNPDYPQEIVNISGKSTLKDVGKNLFDKTTAEVGKYVTENGELGNSNNFSASDYIQVVSGNSYTYSGCHMYDTFASGGAYYDENKGFVSSFKMQYSGTITIPQNAKYVRFSMRHAENDEDTFMFEFGTTASTYESYKKQSFDLDLPFELCRIEDYKDRIYPLNGKWYLEKKIGKVVLNGSESWTLPQTNTNTLRFNCEQGLIDGLDTGTMKIISNKFVNGKATSDNNDYEHIRSAVKGFPNMIAICINKSRLSSQNIDGFKTWLSNNNVTVYYIATPITEEITESNYPTLYEQLNNIKLFEGVNHLTFTNESGLDVEFDIEYYKDWKLD